MRLLNKFRTGDLIYIPQGVYLYDDGVSGIHVGLVKTWYPSLGVYLGQKLSKLGYCDVNVEGEDYWISPDDIENLNFARKETDVHQTNSSLS